MKLTIIPDDSAVIVDGVRLTIDCSSLGQSIHAMQWDGVLGHIEYAVAANGEKPTNEAISDIAQFQPLIAAWTAAKALIDNPPAPPAPTFEQAKAAKLAELNLSCETQLSAIKAGYPSSEVDSWSKQEAEARAYAVDHSAATPLLTALALARGVDLATLAGKIIVKADQFAAVSGAIIGKRQHYEDMIATIAVGDQAFVQLANIVWVA